jgi:RNA polymerase sigma-70 factor (ECF subfamily)
MKTAPPSDDDLVRRLRAGDEDGFRELYGRWQGPIYRFALRLSGAAQVAEDVTQEVFMALLGGTGYDAARGPLGAYLYGIARNQTLRRLDRERGLVALPDEPAGAAPRSANGGSPHDELERRLEVEAVREAVLSLPPHYREPVVLCELQALSYDDAARVLGCPVGTVRSRLHRARELLAAKLGAPPSAARTQRRRSAS